MESIKKKVVFCCAIVLSFILGGLTFTYILLWASFDTEMPDSFNEASWNIVEVGMGESEVIPLIGEPLSVVQWTDGKNKTLNYSKSASDNANYVHYYLVVCDGKVMKKEKERFWD